MKHLAYVQQPAPPPSRRRGPTAAAAAGGGGAFGAAARTGPQVVALPVKEVKKHCSTPTATGGAWIDAAVQSLHTYWCPPDPPPPPAAPSGPGRRKGSAPTLFLSPALSEELRPLLRQSTASAMKPQDPRQRQLKAKRGERVTEHVLYGLQDTDIFTPQVCFSDGTPLSAPPTACETAVRDKKLRKQLAAVRAARRRNQLVDVRLERTEEEDREETSLVHCTGVGTHLGRPRFRLIYHPCAVPIDEILRDINEDYRTGAPVWDGVTTPAPARPGHYRFYKGRPPVVDGLSALGVHIDRKAWITASRAAAVTEKDSAGGGGTKTADADGTSGAPAGLLPTHNVLRTRTACAKLAAAPSFRLPVWGDPNSEDWKDPDLLWWVTYEPTWEDAGMVNFDAGQQAAFADVHKRRQAREAEEAARRREDKRRQDAEQ